jgi:cell division protein FtsI (penicillin-binding protein 3)
MATNIKSEILKRVRIASLFVFLAAIAIIWRMAHIQFVQGEYWKQQAREKTTQRRAITATRGNIFSDNGSLLATSLPRYRLAFDPSILKDEDHVNDSIIALSRKLAQHFGGETKEFQQKINDARTEKKEYLVLSPELISFSEMKKIRQFPIFNRGRYKGGVIFERIDERYKPFEHLARRTIGFINASKDGAGLEMSFNKQLAGHDGEALFQKIAGGNWKPVYDGEDVKPEPGLDVYTTIDINLQDVAETSLLEALEANKANYGCVVLMEVKTGAIKALANLGKIGDNRYAETYNYAVGPQGLTDPGSTFKLASLMALFEETGLELTDQVNTGNGEYKYYDAVMRDSKEHGTVTVQEAFELSSNIAFLKLVTNHFGDKPNRFINYLKSFGLDSDLGFQMRGAAKCVLKTPQDKTWSKISLPWISVGYESQMSPLQILTFYNAVANNGKMIKPLIVKEVRQDDEVVEKYDSGIIREKICSDKTLAKLRKCLIGVVERGTASNIRTSNYKIAGKTGTSQRIKNKRYIENYYTSFAGFFPADNPKYSCIVVIDNPQSFNQYGSDVAAPVFKDIADKIYARDVEMHKNLGTGHGEEGVFPTIKSGNADDLQFICTELKVPNRVTPGLDWASASINQNFINWKRKTVLPDRLPDVTGMTLRDALYILENKGLIVKWQGRGRVKSQSEDAGTRLIKGSTIRLELE